MLDMSDTHRSSPLEYKPGS